MGRLSYANVVSTLALVVAVGGGGVAVASGLARNSVASPQIKNNSVQGVDVKNDSLTGADIVDTTVRSNLMAASTPDLSTRTTPSSEATVRSVSLTVPASGFVVLTANAEFKATSSTNGYIMAYWYDGKRELIEADWDSGDYDNYFDQRQTLVHVAKVSKGKHTFNFKLEEYAAASPSEYYGLCLVAQYYPAGSGSLLAAARASGTLRAN